MVIYVVLARAGEGERIDSAWIGWTNAQLRRAMMHSENPTREWTVESIEVGALPDPTSADQTA